MTDTSHRFDDAALCSVIPTAASKPHEGTTHLEVAAGAQDAAGSSEIPALPPASHDEDQSDEVASALQKRQEEDEKDFSNRAGCGSLHCGCAKFETLDIYWP